MFLLTDRYKARYTTKYQRLMMFLQDEPPRLREAQSFI
jgi:hypothetical protein